MFIAGVNDSNLSYRWQVDSGNGFTNISNNTLYYDTTTDSLQLINSSTNMYGNKYTCIISSPNGSLESSTFSVNFSNTWAGSVDSAWENSSNWSCGTIPDVNTNVIIRSGIPNSPVIASNAFCRCLISSNAAMIKVKTGYNLNITGKKN